MAPPRCSDTQTAHGPSSGTAGTRLHAATGPVAGPPGLAGAPSARGSRGGALVEALRADAHVPSARHASTETDRIGARSTQRMLREAGWRKAREIRRAAARLGVPVGRVLSGEACHPRQTANLALGGHERTPAPGVAPTDPRIAEMRESFVPLLVEVPPLGLERVSLGHDGPFETATGPPPEPREAASATPSEVRGALVPMAPQR